MICWNKKCVFVNNKIKKYGVKMRARIVKTLFFSIIVFLFLFSCAKLNEPAVIDTILKIVTTYSTYGFAREIDLTENYIYIAEDQGGISIYDILSDTLVCHYLGEIENARLIDAVEETDRLFVYDRYGSPAQIRVYDISNPADIQIEPPIITQTQGIEDMKCFPNQNNTVNIAVTRNDSQYEYRYGVWDGFYYNPIYTYSNFTITLNGFDQDENYIYLAYEQLGLNITDRFTGENVGMCDTPGEAIFVKVVDNVVFVADKHQGLSVIDATDPNQPQLVFSEDTSGYAQGLDVSGNLLALASGGGGIYLYDISNPLNPKYLDRIDDQVIGYTYRAEFKNNYLFVATKSGVHKLEINL